ncbi:MAG: polysaccharide pyruvyl transferase family protein [Bacilli bacterium]
MLGKKKMRIGVITFHKALNYGALLQTYALQTFLTQQGYDSKLINYYPRSFKQERKVIDFRSFDAFLKSLIKYPKYQKKILAFDCFLNRCNKTKRYTNSAKLVELNSQFDAFVTGSDQVWNSRWNFNDPAYFLGFADPNKKYSYAASVGSKIEDPFLTNKFISEVSSFNKISLRENSTALWLKGILKDKDIETNVDPALLLSKEDWLKLVKKKKEKPFLLIYTLEDDKELIEFAKKEAAKRNLRLVQIRDVFKKEDPEIHYASCISIERFISLFAKADFVVTNSFHGLVFSTIFEKEFIISLQKYTGAPNERLSSFLKKFKLETRLINNFKNEPLDFTEIKAEIEIEKNKAIAYFKSIEKVDNKVFPLEEEKCANCTACYTVCPPKAIEMKEGQLGFSYPVIDLEKCIHCGLCEKVCMYINEDNKIVNKLTAVLAVKNKRESQRLNSRSGGVFPLLAEKVLASGGAVYGASIDPDNFLVSHLRIDKKEDIHKLTKSKYVESKLNDTFHSVIADLKNQKEVLFSGVPCQNAGLRYLLKIMKIDDSKLLYVDLICHGYMSPEVYRAYLTKQKKQYVNISNFEFRDKEFGWDSHFESFISNGNKIAKKEYTDIFYTNSFLRPACYECLYTNLNRPGDITLGDGWGVKNELTNFDDNKGVSLILINNKKGQLAFSSIADKTVNAKIQIEKVMQHNLEKQTVKSSNHKRLEKLYAKKGYEAIAKESSAYQNKQARLNKIKSKISKLLKKLHLK